MGLAGDDMAEGIEARKELERKVLREAPGYDFDHEGEINTGKPSPIDMRKALIVVEEYKKAGIMFVAVPVLNDKDGDSLCNESFRRLDLLEKQIESES